MYVWVRRSATPGAIGKSGCARSSAWIWDFSSTHRMIARFGGDGYNRTISCTLSTNSGAVDSLKVSLRCGCKPNAAQIRRIVVCDSPVAAAIERIDQWVASLGVVFSVRSITSATCPSETVRGRPGRFSSVRPSIRSLRTTSFSLVSSKGDRCNLARDLDKVGRKGHHASERQALRPRKVRVTGMFQAGAKEEKPNARSGWLDADLGGYSVGGWV